MTLWNTSCLFHRSTASNKKYFENILDPKIRTLEEFCTRKGFSIKTCFPESNETQGTASLTATIDQSALSDSVSSGAKDHFLPRLIFSSAVQDHFRSWQTVSWVGQDRMIVSWVVADHFRFLPRIFLWVGEDHSQPRIFSWVSKDHFHWLPVS